MKMILLRGSFIFRERKSWNCNFTDICRTGKCMGTDIDDDFLHPVCDNIIPFSLLGRDVYLLIYVTSDVCLVDCDMAEKCEKQ